MSCWETGVGKRSVVHDWGGGLAFKSHTSLIQMVQEALQMCAGIIYFICLSSQTEKQQVY